MESVSGIPPPVEQVAVTINTNIDNRSPDEVTVTDDLGTSDPLTTLRKRKAESEDGHEDGHDEDPVEPTEQEQGSSIGTVGAAAPLSKNQVKKLRRQQRFEEHKEERKLKRKEQRHHKQARKRAAREALVASGADLASRTSVPEMHELVPVAFIIDCDFEAYMNEGERTSVASQVERCYSENRKAKYRAHLVIASWKGKLRERYEKVLHNNHVRWKGIHMIEGDFLEGSKVAQESMKGAQVETTTTMTTTTTTTTRTTTRTSTTMRDRLAAAEPPNTAPSLGCTALRAGPAAKSADGLDTSIVYLTADSPNSLDRLKTNTCYVIGGIVDRNREKGLCYKRGQDALVQTAKLPIAEFMTVQSRFVLTVNQVVEIMLKWLESGDWGKAFADVIPKRKGGSLKEANQG